MDELSFSTIAKEPRDSLAKCPFKTAEGETAAVATVSPTLNNCDTSHSCGCRLSGRASERRSDRPRSRALKSSGVQSSYTFFTLFLLDGGHMTSVDLQESFGLLAENAKRACEILQTHCSYRIIPSSVTKWYYNLSQSGAIRLAC